MFLAVPARNLLRHAFSVDGAPCRTHALRSYSRRTAEERVCDDRAYIAGLLPRSIASQRMRRGAVSFATPLDTITTLLEARARGDIDAAVACYERTALVVLQPGLRKRGREAIRGLVGATIGLPISFSRRVIVETENVALHISHWKLKPEAGPEVTGATSDVLRRQADGRWLLAIDNPWGAGVTEQENG